MSKLDKLDKRSAAHDEAQQTKAPKVDLRKPYEAPRLVKKRSVAQATLFTAMGPTTNAITMMG